MSEVVGKDAFAKASERRIADMEIAGVGTVRIRNLLTSEYLRIEGLAGRAFQSFSSNKNAQGRKLLMDAKVCLVTQCVLDSSNSPMFTADDADAIAGWDYAILSAIETACTEHCGFEGLDVEQAAKNSSETT